MTKGKKKLDCKDTFLMFQSFGFPIEMIEEECKKSKIKFSKKNLKKNVKLTKNFLEQHQKENSNQV